MKRNIISLPGLGARWIEGKAILKSCAEIERENVFFAQFA
jgi:hypothetical protein